MVNNANSVCDELAVLVTQDRGEAPDHTNDPPLIALQSCLMSETPDNQNRDNWGRDQPAPPLA